MPVFNRLSSGVYTEFETFPQLIAHLEKTKLEHAGRYSLQATRTGDPMHCYLFPDGTLVRAKPYGDGINAVGTMTFSVEVVKSGVQNLAAKQEAIAFKTDQDATPLPKGKADILNPYDSANNGNQHKAFEMEVMKAVHSVVKQP